MKMFVTIFFIGATMALSAAAVADDNVTLRVVQVQTDDLSTYIAELSKGEKLIKAVNKKFIMRAWQASFAGEDTGAVIVAVEYPGSFAEFGAAWERLRANPEIAEWQKGLAAFRTVLSDSLYDELPL